MIWMRVVVGILVCWAGSAAAATLTWNENTEGNLAGYRVYHCTVIPCTPSSGNQSLLVNLGKVTSYNIGTPSSTKHYYVTAIDTSNAESASSGVVTYSPSSMPAVSNLTLTVVGTPTQGKWGVEAATTDLRDVMATVYLDGKMYLTDNSAPYSFPASSGFTTTGTFGKGTHKVEFVFYLQGTATEIGRANFTVQEGTSSTASSPVTLTVVGNPATGPWGVEGKTTDQRDVMANIYLDGKLHDVNSYAPYGFPDDNNLGVVPGRFGAGSHTVQFIFFLQDTTIEIGRASVTVVEGSPNPVSLSVTGSPAASNWGVVGNVTDTRDVMATIFLDGTLHHTENEPPYAFPGDDGTTLTTARFGSGTHTVQFIFYLQGTATELGRSSVTVKEGP
jgi:hypothetical protein